MLDKIKERFNNIKNNPKFQEKFQEMRPKKSIWGFLAVILLFFVPELINVLYSQDINAWIVEFAKTAPNQQMGNLLIWMSKKTFTGEIGWINLAFGVVFLVWLFRGK